MEPIDKAVFLSNLRLTQIYCEQQLQHTKKNSASILRSINPVCNGKPVIEFELQTGYLHKDSGFCFIANWTVDPHQDVNGFSYSELFQKQLEIKEAAKLTNSDAEYNGEILVAEFEDSTADGAPEVESGGLLDIWDCPPIDTWFHQLELNGRKIFFAWIPQPFVKLANNGIEVAPLDNIHWFKKWAPLEYKRLLG
ncbi:MAG TPA: hypothetical protein VF630_00450 [Hymenobacter sp.]|jgi:hypothetical protein